MMKHIRRWQRESSRNLEARTHSRIIVVELKTPLLGHYRAIVAIVPSSLIDQTIGDRICPRLTLEPHLDCDLIRQIQTRAVWDQHKIVHPIKQEALPDFPRRKTGAVVQLPM